MTLTLALRGAAQQQILRPSAPPPTTRLFTVWVGSSIPAQYQTIQQLCADALALVPTPAPEGYWTTVEVLLKAGEGGTWQSAFDSSPLAISGPGTLASHRASAQPLGVAISPYVVVRAQPAWIAAEQAMVRQLVNVAGRCVLNVEPGDDYYNGPTDPGFIRRGYLLGCGVPASALEVCMIPRAAQVAELGGIDCLQAWTDPTLVGRASWECYGISAPGGGVNSLEVDVAIPRLDGWGVPPGLQFRVPVVQHDERNYWAPTIWCAGGMEVWQLAGN